MTGSSFCPEPLLLGGELNIKHFNSQKSLLEVCKQPGHCPLQDPSDQPCSEENRAQRRNLRREQKDAGDRRLTALSTVFLRCRTALEPVLRVMRTRRCHFELNATSVNHFHPSPVPCHGPQAAFQHPLPIPAAQGRVLG